MLPRLPALRNRVPIQRRRHNRNNSDKGEGATLAAVDPVSRSRVHPQSLLEQIRNCQARGWAETHEFPSPGHCSIAAALPTIPGQPQLGLCIGSSTAIMHRDKESLVTALMHARERFEQMTRRARRAKE
jgi:DNA-binding IclR family transcriptional regulator